MSGVTNDTEWSEAAPFTQQEHPDLMDDDLSGAFSGFESDHEQDKDSIELELEKAVFGDKVGFHERLENHRTVEDGLVGSAAHRATVGKNVIGETQDNLRDIADADVCSPAKAIKLLPRRSFCPSSSSLTPGLRSSFLSQLFRMTTPTRTQTNLEPYGMIVMMTASLYRFRPIPVYGNYERMRMKTLSMAGSTQNDFGANLNS